MRWNAPDARTELALIAAALLSLMILLIFQGCASVSPPAVPAPCTWQLWAGAPATGSIVRAQEKKVISCASPEFAGFVCMDEKAFENLLTCGRPAK